MSKEKIQEGNKLIAEFLEWEKEDGFYCAWNEQVDKVLTSEMLFHYSWDWLMPVVEKIEAMQSEGYNTLIEGRNCWIDYNGISFSGSSKDSKIEAVWLAVAAFIEWYNQNKK